MNIPLHKPFFDEKEINAAIEALKAKDIVGNSAKCREAEKEIARLLNVKKVFLTTSCTTAMELGLIGLGAKKGEVIMPSYTFAGTAGILVKIGLKPVFVDIDENGNIDSDKIEEKITKETKAIIPVHYACQACEIEKITEIARKHNLAVIEDAAHVFGGKYNGKYLGTFGDAGCFSFHATKNLTCGEGGALATNNEELIKKIDSLRDCGTNREEFLKGRVKFYSWVSEGSNALMPNMLGAIILEQLRKADKIKKERERCAEYYNSHLKNIKGIRLPLIKNGNDSSWHIYAITADDRDFLVKSLNERGIGVSSHFVPLHLSEYGIKLGYKEKDFPVTEKFASSIIRLPIYPELSENELGYIVNTIAELQRGIKL